MLCATWDSSSRSERRLPLHFRSGMAMRADMACKQGIDLQGAARGRVSWAAC